MHVRGRIPSSGPTLDQNPEVIPSDPPAAGAALFSLERERLLDLLGSFSEGDWERSTPCPGWDVADLAAHLLGDDLGLLARQRDGHHGTVPPAGATAAGFAEWLDRLQDDWVRAARRISPRLTVDLLAWTGPQVERLMRAQDPRARTGHVSWAADGPVPRWLDQLRELSEQWIHRQHILQALGRPDDLRVDLLIPILDALRWAYPHRLAGVGRPAGTTVTVAVGEPAGVIWHLVAGTAGWDHHQHAIQTPAAALRLTAGQAWRLLTNNLPAEEQAGLPATGDAELVAAVLGTRAIIGIPK